MNQLIFDSYIAKDKPENIKNKEGYCPFCHYDKLTDIISKEDDKVWVTNKYKTLKDTEQTLVIESSKHEGDASNYSISEHRQIIEFVLRCWRDMYNMGIYKSVLLYKNFGPYSGGSLRHPHFQIVGLRNMDGYSDINYSQLTGDIIFKKNSCEVSLSNQPIMGFDEFNICLNKLENVDIFSDMIQIVIKYILSNDYYNEKCNSYNLFFYPVNNQIICKVVPRFITSGYFVGYKIAQVSSMGYSDLLKRKLYTKLSEHIF